MGFSQMTFETASYDSAFAIFFINSAQSKVPVPFCCVLMLVLPELLVISFLDNFVNFLSIESRDLAKELPSPLCTFGAEAKSVEFEFR